MSKRRLLSLAALFISDRSKKSFGWIFHPNKNLFGDSAHLVPKLGCKSIWRVHLIFLQLTLLSAGLPGAERISAGSDPLVIKVYPDGTQLILKWSEIGKCYDDGAAHGGPPQILPYRPLRQAGFAPNDPESARSAPANYSRTAPETGTPLEGFYLSPALGGSVVQDYRGYGGSVVYEFNAGIRFDCSVGYRFNEWCSLELTPGLIYNNIESITILGERFSVDGEILQVPLLLNVILTIPTQSSWEPFLGLGIGGVYTSTTTEAFSFYGPGTTTAWNLGYSALAGLNYHIDPDLSVGFIYKFTGINQSGSNYEDLMTQSVQAQATFRF